MDSLKISRQINYDIDTGMYMYFQKLRERLLYISGKLDKMEYCKNISLTKGEKNTLRENEYLR